MLALSEVLAVYVGLAAVAVYVVWRLIGRQGFVGLEDTDSRLARHFRKATPVVADNGRIARV